MLCTYVCAECGYVMFVVPPEKLEALPRQLEDGGWARVAASDSPRHVHSHEPEFLKLVIKNTLSVLVSEPAHRKDWYQALEGFESQAQAEQNSDGVLFFRTIRTLLDANGQTSGLGVQLRGVYAETWQRIVKVLDSRP